MIRGVHLHFSSYLKRAKETQRNIRGPTQAPDEMFIDPNKVFKRPSGK